MRRQAQAHARLSPEEESRLLERGDAEAATNLVEHNLDLVVDQAERHRDLGLTFADLYQEGAVGLLDAVAAYQGQGDFRDFASLHIGLQMDSLIETEREARREADQYVVDSRTLDLAEISIATFHGTNFLKRVNGGAFEVTDASGQALYGKAGTIVGSSLEGSNTDIADEFTKLIVTQQAYSANTKVITTSNTMVQDLLNVLR